MEGTSINAQKSVIQKQHQFFAGSGIFGRYFLFDWDHTLMYYIVHASE